MGVFPPDWKKTAFRPAAVRKVTTRQSRWDFSPQYGDSKGDAGLRRALSQKIGAINVHAGPEQIVTTVGTTHALDGFSLTLLFAGDCVMVEEPRWTVEFAWIDALSMRILSVPRGPAGPTRTRCVSWHRITISCCRTRRLQPSGAGKMPPGGVRWTGLQLIMYVSDFAKILAPGAWQRRRTNFLSRLGLLPSKYVPKELLN